MPKERVQQAFETIKTKFMCCVPIKNIKFEDISPELTDWDVQERLIQQTVNSEPILTYPVKIEYQRIFLKHLIEMLVKQNAEVNDVVYDALGRLMSLREPQANFKHYILNETRIILKENSSIISKGTTGLCTWQASIALAEWSLENKALFKNQRVLELGSGVGLTGLVISKLCSPKKYIFTDCHSSVLNHLRDNVKLNLNMREMDTNNGNNVVLHGFYESSEIKVLNLPWETITFETSEMYETDIAIAADVVYDRELFLPLYGSFKFLLKHGVCSVIFLACTERNQDTLEEFLDLLGNETHLMGEFAIETLRTPSPKLFYWDSKVPIKIFKISFNKT